MVVVLQLTITVHNNIIISLKCTIAYRYIIPRMKIPSHNTLTNLELETLSTLIRISFLLYREQRRFFVNNLTVRCNLLTSHPQGRNEVRCEINEEFIGVAPALACPCGLVRRLKRQHD